MLAALATLRVEVADPLAGGVSATGFSEHVVFAGHPDTVNPTELLNPLAEAIVTVELPDCPGVSVIDAGLADIEKSGGGVTFSVTPAACESDPELPVMVSVAAPVAVAAVVTTLSVDVAEPLDGGVTETGFKVHVAFAGQPVTVKPTAPLKPFADVTVTVELPLWPCPSVSDAGLLDIEKSGAATDPQELNLNDPIAVLQLKLPVDFKYSLVYQKVQSSAGSIRSAV